MSEAAPISEAIEGEEAAAPAAPRRGRPPRQPVVEAVAVADEPDEPMVWVVISVKPSEAWRCPWVDGRITKPREELLLPLSLAEHMQAHEQAIILKGNG